ncbi:competence protein ComK [Salinibacillus xinjiangensis]|uniref:Competence protein n=1 Tax=Salinibacillus xinjiangensis TaxID=1229268 RepID=A0A6G1X2D2_9BACI|nr:competence protein ComK [Salinibacillus xinjiangensis]MRG85094.1 hypothetical protein [Salinibacillus xinjiangensis]
MNKVEEYEINRNTILITPHYDPVYRTRILEKNREIYCTKTSLQIIEEACINGGASMNGRKQAMEKILQTKVKVPIPVDPSIGVFLFPNKSPKEMNCYWFSFFHIKEYLKSSHDGNKTEIIFTNKMKQVIDTSFFTFRRQMYLTSLAIAMLSRNAWLKKDD